MTIESRVIGTPVPRIDGRVELRKMPRVEGETVSHLMAKLASLLRGINPGGLATKTSSNTVSIRPGPGEFVRRRGLE